MQKQTPFKILFTFAVTTLLILPLVSQSLKAQGASRISEPIFDPSIPQTESEVDFWVVRVYFTERQQVDQIATWTEPWEVNYEQGYLVLEVTVEQFNLLVAQGFQVEVYQELTDQLNRPRAYLPEQTSGIPGFPCYRTVEETFNTATDIVAEYPDLAEWVDIGDSWEKTEAGGLPGYDMMVLKLTNSNIGGDKPKLFIMTALHAREYTTAELNTRFAEYLVENYNKDADVTWLLDSTEIHLLLQSNPDGRKHAESGLSWRKNTNENYCGATSNYRGADLNRNFEFQWGCCGGSSPSECDLTYRGPSAASEPEVQAIQNYVRSIFPDQRGDNPSDPAPDDAMGVFLDIHSYSELVIWPWGYTATVAPNSIALQTLGRKFAFFNDYEPDQAIGLYPTDGTTDDFAYGELGLAAYTFELGTAFFQACETFENTIYPDNLPALIYAAKASRTPYLTPAGPDTVGLRATPQIVEIGNSFTLEATINDTRYNNQNGAESTQNIASAAYYIDTPPWETGATPDTMTAVDGNFNSSIEDVTATIGTGGLSTGRHTIFVRGQDTAGNWGAVSAVFIYVINPATAPTIQGYVREASTNTPLDATIEAFGPFQTSTDPSTGFYQMQVISGTYDLKVTTDDYASQTLDGIVASEHQTITQDLYLYPFCTAFSDDVESGNIGWSTDYPWAVTTESKHSPTHSWTDSPGGNYGNDLDISLTSPSIDLTGFSDVHLDFWQTCNTETSYDFCHVEISDDDGVNWTEIGTYHGYQYQWENIDLPAEILANQPDARIRFRLTTDANTTRDGWHIDDIQLIGAGANCIVYLPPTADFNSTSPDPLGTTTTFTNTSYGSDLHYEWDFGDLSPVVTDTHPTHTYSALGFYTVTLTVTNMLGTGVYSDVVEIFEPSDAQLSFAKSVSQANVHPSEVFTYTLQTQLTLTGTHTYTVSLTDPIPDGLAILSDTIELMGIPRPELYDPASNAISGTLNGNFSDATEISLTFQAQVAPDTVSGTWITNQATAQAWVDGLLVPDTARAQARVTIKENRPPTGTLILDKNASMLEVQSGEVFSYTLNTQIVLTDSHTYATVFTDTLPTQVSVLTESIRVDGVPMPEIYFPDTHMILYSASGTFTDTYNAEITFRVKVGSEVISGTLITNQLDGQATIDGEPSPPPKVAEVTVRVVTPFRVFLPILHR